MLTVRRSNQSILKKISPGCSLEGIMLKLKLQYFGHLMRRVDSLEKTLMLGGIGGRRRGRQRMRWLNGITRWTWVWVNSGSWWWTGRPGVLQFMGSQRVGHDWATELNWTVFFQGRRKIHLSYWQAGSYNFEPGTSAKFPRIQGSRASSSPMFTYQKNGFQVPKKDLPGDVQLARGSLSF